MLRAAVTALRKQFGELVLSPVYETPAEGFVGDPFYNLVAGLYTTRPLAELQAILRTIEEKNGRTRSGEKFSARTLDIDVLTYGGQVGGVDGKAMPCDEIVRYAFVLKPLADVAAAELHPQLGVSYQDLWQGFTGNKASLRLVDFVNL